ncbi:hypothetical protein TNCV_839541 [Trichonephila clavipes]|nr:hypothetical protein TNCV_839541 [Trichonephila clavipes]
MRKAICDVWGHSCSTDDEPIHWFCPTNPNTWCKYNAAINNNLQNYEHKPSVAKAVRDVIKPVFADLSHPALLKKCLGVPLRQEGTLNNIRAVSPLMSSVEGEKRERPLTSSRVFSLKIGEEPNQIVLSPVWC